MKKQPTLYDQYAWASRDSRSAQDALSHMISQLEKKEASLEDCRPFFDLVQRMDQKLLDIEATIRREEIRMLDVSKYPAKLDPQLEVNISVAIRYLREMQEQDEDRYTRKIG